MDNCKHGFSCSNHMVLEHKQAGTFDLFNFLFLGELDQRKFASTPGGTSTNFGYRWLIFLSLMAQLLMQMVKKPLAWIGAFLEFFLNLPSANHNLFRLVLNIFRGKFVQPDKTAPMFRSSIALTDKREHFDKSISHGDKRYNAQLSIMASKVSYENKAFIKRVVTDHWKMDFLGSYDFWNEYQGEATTQAFLCCDKSGDHDVIVVAFRGTEPFDADAWSTDFDISWYEFNQLGIMHYGFLKALGLQRTGWPLQLPKAENGTSPAYYALREMLKQHLQSNDNARFIVTGHSLGGALAILFPAILAWHEESWLLERMEGVYTFGQPRVGDKKFGDYVSQQFKKFNIPYYRFVYCNDMVPRVPFDTNELLFKHFGTCIYFNNLYEGQVLQEEPNKNYFSILHWIPKIINAIWELIRGFFMPIVEGPDYKESFVLRLMRCFGLVIPGIPPHCPQDYVNSIRLASPELFDQSIAAKLA